MNVISNFKFFENASSAGESRIFYNPNKGSVLVLEIQATGDVEIEMQGLVNVELANPNFTSLAAIDLNSLSKTESITKSGIYAFGIDGVSQVRVVVKSITGSVTVFGRLGE